MRRTHNRVRGEILCRSLFALRTICFTIGSIALIFSNAIGPNMAAIFPKSKAAVPFTAAFAPVFAPVSFAVSCACTSCSRNPTTKSRAFRVDPSCSAESVPTVASASALSRANSPASSPMPSPISRNPPRAPPRRPESFPLGERVGGRERERKGGLGERGGGREGERRRRGGENERDTERE